MEQRGTSLDQLNDTSSSTEQPVQTPMHNNTQTDNELVDDILKEINQNQTDGNAAAQYHQPHIDSQTQHNMPPATEQDVQDYQQAEIDTATVQTNGDVVSEGEQLLREQSVVDNAPKGFLASFDGVTFAKTLLLTMILFIVVTNAHTQSLVCKIPSFCSAVNGVMQLNFVGTSVLALLCGLVMASVQVLV